MSHAAASTLDRLLELADLLQRDMDRFVVERGTTPARVHLLWLLGEHGPSTQGALATRLAVSPRNVTGLVDGLVADELATREPHEADRRAVLVTPTERGQAFVAELRQGRVDFAATLFDDVPSGDLAAFERVLAATIGRMRTLGEP